MPKKKSCYIAGKIGGLAEEEFLANFYKAKEEVRKLGYRPVSPTELPHEHNRTWCAYMCEDLRAMLECDAVYALRNWRQSPGATIEIELALKVGNQIIHQQ